MLHPGSCPQGWNGDVGNFNNQARARDLAGHGDTNVGILECVGERITAELTFLGGVEYCGLPLGSRASSSASTQKSASWCWTAARTRTYD